MSDEPSIKNKPLYNILMKFIEKAFKVLFKNMDKLQAFQMNCISITDQSIGEFIGYVPEFKIFIISNEPELISLPEYHKCVKIILEDKLIRDNIDPRKFIIFILTELLNKKRFYTNDLTKFIKEFNVRKNIIFNFDFEVFKKIYIENEKALYSDKEIMALIPLLGFKFNGNVIDLNENIKIKKLTNEELEKLWYDFSSFPYSLRGFDHYKQKYYLIITSRNNIELNETINSVISTLRLWKSGDIYYDTMISFYQWNPYEEKRMKLPTYYYGSTPLILNSSEIEGFKQFYVNLTTLNFFSNKVFFICIDRLNISYERKRYEDKLIDYMIAFESLFSTGPGDLSYKIPLRIAKILNDKPDERKEIFIILKKAFNIRNDIVHGNKKINDITIIINHKKIEYSLKDFNLVIENYLRDAIMKFITYINKSNINKKKVLQIIDFN